jgi:epoxyqueuosine reductase QueG
MEHPVLMAIRREGFTPLGWFEGGDAAFTILIGNAGPDMFRRFGRERDPGKDSLDDWTRVVVDRLAADLEARAVYPFDKPPLPFLTWARKAGAGHVSPLGLNIHPTFGLWHAFRAAFLFPVVFDLPKVSPGAHPCEACEAKPCLSACPVHAFSGEGYDVQSCAEHLRQPEGHECMEGGCLARRACPVGQGFRYSEGQIRFHMKAFLKARQAASC